MASITIPNIQPLLHELTRHQRTNEQGFIGASYDSLGDVLYISFHEPNVAADSEWNDDDVIVRYDEQGEVIGLTILHASKRK
jgi:uncharacterized protein YuzE